ncbi:MAG: type I glyceraldehyde-3-phosphate dehydrogenase [Candidatus Andersenbacteria bacterium]|nr:type I glyceraldehyde-3-phosphate dehydrogenase [bacterium]MDZ4225611.1 type I glyceraldehyde-3-phosphate dehydrogenase [Candidatus Andersenbacteria bacterium]
MKTKIAINGFGRIGRAVFKIALENDDVEMVAINDLGDPENLAYLLRYDTVYGRYARKVTMSDGVLRVDDKEIKVLNEREPDKLPWGEMGIDTVIESTGVFTEEEEARRHITAGAKHVIISAPTKSEGVATVVMGVNDKDLAGKEIVSNASCTTNCVAPMVAVMDNAFGVEKAVMTTVHAYTATQSVVDGPAKKDFRRGRAAAANMVPSSTGAAIAATKAYQPLAGKFDGVALRVPVPVVSMSDCVLVTKKEVTVEEIVKVFEEAASNPLYEGVLAVTSEPVVSSDFIGDPHSVTVDLAMTRVVGGNLVKVMGWYDNEWGYSNRLVEQAVAIRQSAK